MQDMTSAICDTITTPTQQNNNDTPETQLIDTRDGKTYWVAKLKDGKCWMTQNLDLDLETTPTNVVALTSENTDLNTYGLNGYDSDNGYDKNGSIITWAPERSTVSTISATGYINGNISDYNNPSSVDPGDWYWTDTWYASTRNNYLAGNVGNPAKFQKDTPYAGNGAHGHVGNYYNWSAAVASNDTSSYAAVADAYNSICPVGWRLPIGSSNGDLKILLDKYEANVSSGSERDRIVAASPLWFVRGGNTSGSTLSGSGLGGAYWSGSVVTSLGAYTLEFQSSSVVPVGTDMRNAGFSIRCVAR